MEKRLIKNVGMIAGGSGIAPMFQLIQTVTDLENDSTSLSLLYSNRTPVSPTTITCVDPLTPVIVRYHPG